MLKRGLIILTGLVWLGLSSGLMGCGTVVSPEPERITVGPDYDNNPADVTEFDINPPGTPGAEAMPW